jgi:hypothetical protein
MTNQDIVIRNSVVVLFTQRVEETMERAQHAENLLGAVDELKARLAKMTEAARIAESRLKQVAQRAREEGRAAALAEAEEELRKAERRRLEVQTRLQQAQEERDQAMQLMRQAQRQALNARNELEELRRKAELDASLGEARRLMQRAAADGGTVREDRYENQIASADAELNGLRAQLAELSAELEVSGVSGDSAARSGQTRSESAAATDVVYNDVLSTAEESQVGGRTTDKQSSVDSTAADAMTSPPPGPRSYGDGTTDRAPHTESSNRNQPVRTTRSRTGYPQSGGGVPRATGTRTPSPRTGSTMPVASSSSSRIIGVMLAVPLLALYVVDGIGIRLMATARVGPAIVWQIVYDLLAFLLALLLALFICGIIYDREKDRGIQNKRTSDWQGVLSIFVGPPVMFATIFLHSQNTPILGPVSHWFVFHIGPM